MERAVGSMAGGGVGILEWERGVGEGSGGSGGRRGVDAGEKDWDGGGQGGLEEWRGEGDTIDLKGSICVQERRPSRSRRLESWVDRVSR